MRKVFFSLLLVLFTAACGGRSATPAAPAISANPADYPNADYALITCNASGFTVIMISGEGHMTCTGDEMTVTSAGHTVALEFSKDAQGFHWTYPGSGQICWAKGQSLTLPTTGSASQLGSQNHIVCSDEVNGQSLQIIMEAEIVDPSRLEAKPTPPSGPDYGAYQSVQPNPPSDLGCEHNTWTPVKNNEFSFTLDGGNAQMVTKLEGSTFKNTSVVRNQILESIYLKAQSGNIYTASATLRGANYKDGTIDFRVTLYFLVCSGQLYFDPSYNPNSHFQQAFMPDYVAMEAGFGQPSISVRILSAFSFLLPAKRRSSQWTCFAVFPNTDAFCFEKRFQPYG